MNMAQILPIIIYILLIVLIVISIIIGIKVIITMNKVEKVVDNIEQKVNSLNYIFGAIETTSMKLAGIYERILEFITGLVEKLFISKKTRKEDENE